MDAKACDAMRTAMRTAGADSFNMGRPNVPGLDPLWVRELDGNAQDGWARTLARWWRTGWKNQAALVERVIERCPYSFNEYDFPYNSECLYVKGHDGVCSL